MAAKHIMKALYPRPYRDKDGKERTFWHEIGMAYSNDRSGGYDLVLHLTPPQNAKGEYRICLREMDELDRQRGARGGREGGREGRDSRGEQPNGYGYPEGAGSAGPEDEIPF